MTINEKIKFFFIGKKITYEEIGNLYGASGQTIGNYVNGRREIPTEFYVWLKEHFPEIDFNKLFTVSDSINITMDSEKKLSKQQILNEIEKVLSQFIN